MNLTSNDSINETYPEGWEQVFTQGIKELTAIKEILSKQQEYFPRNEDIFKAFHLTPLHKVRVVIIGQDPYPDQLPDGTSRATGLSFSVKRYDNIPSSLRNIFKELSRSIPQFNTPTHGDLTCWAKQGVLLLNMCLTVTPNQPGSHKDLWLGFIYYVITAIIEKHPKCIFVLWGKQAQKLLRMINGRGIVLMSSHPSGYSFNRGFWGCNHFITINKLLIDNNETPIDWNIY